MKPIDLAAFEDEIAAEYNAGKIPYPVHLESGNEAQLIEVFEDIDRQDWVLGSWRMHLKALLHGVPPLDLKAAIRRGESMALNFPEYRVLGSAIVGGTIPIALGVAMGIKRRQGSERVHLFCGDMTSRAGAFHEALTYSENFDLPLRFIIEDNGVSVCTDTAKAWGLDLGHNIKRRIWRYTYTSKFPHAGSGERIQF